MKTTPKLAIPLSIITAAGLYYFWQGSPANIQQTSPQDRATETQQNPVSPPPSPPVYTLDDLIQSALNQGSPDQEQALKELVRIGAPAAQALLETVVSIGYDIHTSEGLYFHFNQYRPTEEVLAEASSTDPNGVQKMKAALGTLIEIGSPAVPLLLDHIHDSGRASKTYCLNYIAVYALGEIGDPSVTPILAELLTNSELGAYVRYRICLALGKIGDKRALPALIQRLCGDDYQAPQSAQKALTLMGPLAVDDLLQLMQNPDKKAQVRAINTLADIKDERAIGPLIQRNDEDDRDIRRAVIRALGRLKAVDAIDAIAANLGRSFVGDTASTALGDIGEPALERCLQAAHDEDEGIRAYATRALGDIGGDLAVETLMKALDDPESDVRFYAVAGLGKNGDPRTTDALIKILNQPHEEDSIRSAAATALGQIGAGRAVESLVAKLESPSMPIRRACVYALGKIGDEAARKSLVASLQDADAKVRKAAATVLEGMSYHPETPREKAVYLIARKQDSSYEEIVTLGIPAVDPLLHVLDDPDVKAQAAQALGQIGAPQAVEPLIKCLQATIEHAVTRGVMLERSAVDEIIMALEHLGDERVVDPFIALLTNPQIDFTMLTKQNVIKILAQKKAKQAIPAIRAYLKDPMLNDSAANALEDMGWTPQSIEDTIYVNIAQGHFDALRQQWEQTQQVLLNDLHSHNDDAVANAALAFIQIGNETILPELIQLINQNGNRNLAYIYLNSEKDELESVAETWVHLHGYKILHLESPNYDQQTWGQGN